MEYTVHYTLHGREDSATFRSRDAASRFIEANRAAITFELRQIWAEKVVRTCVEITLADLSRHVNPEMFFSFDSGE